jgi:hypothetical protein
VLKLADQHWPGPGDENRRITRDETPRVEIIEVDHGDAFITIGFRICPIRFSEIVLHLPALMLGAPAERAAGKDGILRR